MHVNRLIREGEANAFKTPPAIIDAWYSAVHACHIPQFIRQIAANKHDAMMWLDVF